MLHTCYTRHTTHHRLGPTLHVPHILHILHPHPQKGKEKEKERERERERKRKRTWERGRGRKRKRKRGREKERGKLGKRKREGFCHEGGARGGDSVPPSLPRRADFADLHPRPLDPRIFTGEIAAPIS